MDQIGGRLAKQHKTRECCVNIFSENHLEHNILDKTAALQEQNCFQPAFTWLMAGASHVIITVLLLLITISQLYR